MVSASDNVTNDVNDNILSDNVLQDNEYNTKNFEKSTSKDKLSDDVIDVTDGTYNRYFNNRGTLSTVSTGSTLNLRGEFNDKTFIFDKSSLNVNGVNCTLNGGRIYVLDSATNFNLSNITLNTSNVDEAIHIDAENVSIVNNSVYLYNDENHELTVAIRVCEEHNVIKGNTISVQGPALPVNWSPHLDNYGIAPTMGLFVDNVDNCVVENNSIKVFNSTVSNYNDFSTIDGIDLQGTTNTTVDNNKVDVSGARFVYGINALENIVSSRIINNYVNVNSDRYIAGIQSGNGARNNTIRNNTLIGECFNKTLFFGEDEAMAFGIITTSMGGNPSSTFNVSQNTINMNSTLFYGIEVYRTSNSSYSNNSMASNSSYAMGIGLALSENHTITSNAMNLSGNSSVSVNDYDEEIRCVNTGIQVQQRSDNLEISGNIISMYDSSNQSKAININAGDNVTVINNSLSANNITGDDAVISMNNSKNILILNNKGLTDKKDTNITLQTTSTLGNQLLTVKVSDKTNSNIIVNGTVTLKENNSTIQTKTLSNASTVFNLTSLLTKASHNLTVIYNGGLEYNTNNKTINITNKGRTTNLTVKVTNTTSTPLINITVKDNNTNTSLNGNVKILKGNTSIYNGSVVNGVLNINLTNITSGTHNLTVSYTDNNDNIDVNKTITVTKNKKAVIVETESIEGVLLYNIVIRAYITDINGDNLNEGSVIFKLSGKTLRNDGRFDSTKPTLQVKVVNGVAQTTILADRYMKGNHTLSATYLGTDDYDKNTTLTDSPVSIYQRNATLTVTTNVKTVRMESYITYTVTIRDATNNTVVLNNEKAFVFFKLNGLTQKYSNGSMIKVAIINGTATYTYKIPTPFLTMYDNLSVVNHLLVAKYYSPDYDTRVLASNNTTYQVEQSPTKINIKNVSIENNKLIIKANLTDYNNKLLTGTNNIAVKVNGLTISKFNIKNGTIDQTINCPYTNIKTVTITTNVRYSYKAESVTLALTNGSYKLSTSKLTSMINNTNENIVDKTA